MHVSMNKRTLLLLLMLVSVFTYGQRRIRYRYELVGGIGASNFLGDLGGANKIGTHLLRDFDLPVTRAVVQTGIRYKINSALSVRGNIIWAMVHGADENTTELFRNQRDLKFRSPIYEFSGQFEYFFTKEQTGHRYKIKNVKGMKLKDIQGYLFAGFGGFGFNPKAKYTDGKWYALQPLGTEGQGLIAGRSKYHRVSMCLLYGIGGKYGINRYWSIGLEAGFRYTHTDYLDDVSTTYATNTVGAARGPIAQYFADPTQGLGPYPFSVAEGVQRGEPTHKDAYGFVTITANYRLAYSKRKTRSKF